MLLRDAIDAFLGLHFAAGQRARRTQHAYTIDLAQFQDFVGTSAELAAKHLPSYVNEFVFRFNRRRTPMAAFQSLLGLTGQHEPTTYKMLYQAEATG